MIEKCGIYLITNIANGKKYVGSTVNFDKRKSAHLSNLRLNRHHSIKLQSSWRKNGESVFKFEFIEPVADKNHLAAVEQTYINYYKPDYNICQIAGNCLGIKHSEVTRKRLSEMRKGRKHSEEFKQKLRDRVCTAETRKKLSESQKGQVFSMERIENMRLVKLGTRHTEESKAKMSIASTGRMHSEETRKKISQSNIGRIVSGETRKKIGAANKGNKHSPESIEKSSKRKMKKIDRLCLETNEVLDTYDGLCVAEEYGFSTPGISLAISGKRKSHGGFGWRLSKSSS